MARIGMTLLSLLLIAGCSCDEGVGAPDAAAREQDGSASDDDGGAAADAGDESRDAGGVVDAGGRGDDGGGAGDGGAMVDASLVCVRDEPGVNCGGFMQCGAGSNCCAAADGDGFSCASPGAACPAGERTLACDGPEDCDQECCGTFAGPTECRSSCAAEQRVVCHEDADCPSQAPFCCVLCGRPSFCFDVPCG